MSVVIPCFNYGRFLADAIESALQQTYQPVEVIVVNDGSTDETERVARLYPVMLISQPNQGVCAAANTGFKAASGEFVLRLDADDMLTATYVENTLKALRNNPEAQFAYTATAYFGARQGSYPVEEFSVEAIAQRNFVNTSALMRRESLANVGGYNLNMTNIRCEDWDLWLAYAERGMTGIMLPEALLRYRQHPTASRGTLRLSSWRDLRREFHMAGRLHDNHPQLFHTAALLRRLGSLPRRLITREVSPRFSLLLTGFYGAMLAHALVGR